MGDMAIFDPKAPDRILVAAQDDLDWGIAWCCVREGMHPEQIRRLSTRNFDGEWLQWIRVKNEAPRRTLVPELDRERLRAFLKVPKPSRKTIWDRAKKMVARAGYKGGPRVLRKTFILNELRRFRDRHDALDLVAVRAGCRRETVIQHYLDLRQWEQAYA